MSAPGPPGRGMRFAETQLRRHGWRRGHGLGKRQDGIAEAIRVKVKCDTAGVGHDAAEPFTFHWWDHVFNKAAANIAVEAGQDGISVKALSEQGGGISNKKPRKAGGTRDLLYGRFVKSATLTACGEESMTLPTGSESSEEEEEKMDLSSARRLTDEELVQACGGRTAHKGARHGLTMSAKLARLEEQERAFLAMYRCKEQQQELLESSPLAESQGKKKKKRKKSRDRADPEVPQSQESNGEEEEVSGKEVKVVKRKKKKIWERSEEELMGEGEKVMRKKVTEPCGEEEASGEEGKVMKRRKKPEACTEQEMAGEEGKVMKRRKKPEAHTEQEVVDEEGKAAKRKKKKQKQEEEDKEEAAETDIPLEGTGEPDLGHSPRKKRKKKKRKREPE
ncbi:PREDICTED: G patch domain-containing protein 4 [Lepidothrix coronata]|uniref:G patch domain-containing protein 4 n=1 Tax=Lepidothrix coronata TaxID=321398 RepID=A0A6J0GQS0_9PASS|nr:PREDICTED: G patch domain-containing protein 4 [Lepidothrix coronata]